MDYITIHATSADEARQLAAERLKVEPDTIECYEAFEESPDSGPVEPTPAPVASEGDAPEQPVTPVGEGLTPFRARVYPDFWEDEARGWVLGLMKAFGILSEVRVQTIGTQVFVRLSCPEPSILIGRQGYTLEALQHITTRALTTLWPSFPEVVVDVESYKEKKLQRLERSARHAAERAVRSGRPQDLEPMTASERKYIHNALKDFKEVRTVSYGKDPNRHVVVEPLDPTPRPGRGPRDDDGPRQDRPRRRQYEGERRQDRDRREDDRVRPAFHGESLPASEEGDAPAPGVSAEGAFDETVDWRPTFFKPPEVTPADPGEPYPDVEDDLHS